MEVFILVVIVAVIVVFIIAIVSAQKTFKDTEKKRNEFVKLMKEKYPTVIGRHKYGFMYNNDTQKALAFEVDTQDVTGQKHFSNLYVTTAFLCGNGSIYIGSKKLSCVFLNKGHNAYIVDDKHQAVHFIHYQVTKIIDKYFDYDKIISVSIEQNGTTVFSKSTSNTIGRAAVGSLIGGEAGAVVGGLSGKTKQGMKVRKLSVKILVRDVSDSSFEFILYDGKEVEASNEQYINLLTYANAIKDSLCVIIDKTDQTETTKTRELHQPTSTASIADELAKFAKLKDQGIITEEEFGSQKNKLLNSYNIFERESKLWRNY